MADETEQIIEQPSESQKRITQLSDKVRETAEAKETAERKAAEAEASAAEAKRIAEFSEGFIDIVAQNPEAKAFKEEIKAKVLSGYTVQDATFAVLGANGKFGQPAAVQQPYAAVAGGSAVITPPQAGAKSVGEMTQAERRQALIEAEARGDFGLSI